MMDNIFLILPKVLSIMFFWLGTTLPMAIFFEKNKETETLSIFLNIYTFSNVVISIFLIALNDFRIILIATILISIIYSIIFKNVHKKYYQP